MKKFYDKGIGEAKGASHSAVRYSRFVVLTGRRRIGKTSLVYRLVEETKEVAPSLYFFVSRKTEAVLVTTYIEEVRQNPTKRRDLEGQRVFLRS